MLSRFRCVSATNFTVRFSIARPALLRQYSVGSHMSDDDPVVLEREKRKLLNSKVKDWNELLASHSEAVVKADRNPDKSIDELQRESIQSLKRFEEEEAEIVDEQFTNTINEYIKETVKTVKQTVHKQ
ncbi:uncharacterized protein VTP21DRAFT_9312 [Calcarisporiella thermophila]|uniref:uncharacterized protein n=1 Tax=Calcarisporiella thermophila TaxID=911321 RepID=UPI0037431F91